MAPPFEGLLESREQKRGGRGHRLVCGPSVPDPGGSGDEKRREGALERKRVRDGPR